MQKNAFIPCLSTSAGTCLTTQNWQSAGINRAAVHLSDLLMKPGLDVLQLISDIHEFVGWPSHLIMNAYSGMREKAGEYYLRSHYDGTLIYISKPSLLTLLSQLQPDTILLPLNSSQTYNEYWQPLESRMQCYLCADEKIDAVSHYFLAFDPAKSFKDFLSRVQSDADIKYVCGDFTREQINVLSNIPYLSIESDTPAADACAGIAYLPNEHSVSILDKSYEQQHNVLIEHCPCETCEHAMTRAYLHHILQQTPLLGQRLLIQHNIATMMK